MTDLPPDQSKLRDDLLARLERIVDLQAMLHYMAEVLHALLKRRSDVAFLAAIQDAFAAGLLGLSWDEQKALAAEVIRVVIDKRPEIAKAWQVAEEERLADEARAAALGWSTTPAGEAEAPRRREADHVIVPPLPEVPDDIPYDFAEAEGLIAGYLRELLDGRLAVMKVPNPSIPHVAYCHTRPFFLFDPRFATVLKAFVTGPLLQRCRIGLERRVYCKVGPEILARPEAGKAFWTDMRAVVWKGMDARLEKLAQHQKSAETKLDAQQKGIGNNPNYKVVEREVVRPHTYNIMGVEFTLGKQVTTRKVKVRLPPANQLIPEEEEALAMIATLRDRASHAGLELPKAADFQLIRTLLDFNIRLFSQSRDELLGLAGHSETSTRFLRERVHEAEKHFNNLLADILVMMMFTKHGEVRFGLSEFYAVVVGAARDKTSIDAKRPFVPGELSRRPVLLAIQLREALRRKLHVDAVIGSAERFLDCNRVMGKKLYGPELAEARALIEAFPMAFAGDPHEATLVQVGQHVLDYMGGKTVDLSICLVQIGRTYDAGVPRPPAAD